MQQSSTYTTSSRKVAFGYDFSQNLVFNASLPGSQRPLRSFTQHSIQQSNVAACGRGNTTSFPFLIPLRGHAPQIALHNRLAGTPEPL